MKRELYWVWLQLALGAGKRIDEIAVAFDSVAELYKADTSARRLTGVFTANQLKKLEKTPLEDALKVLDICEKEGWQIVTPDSECYPKNFRELKEMPAALYVWGDPEALKTSAAVGMVGTRKASQYAIDVAHRVSAEFASAGITVVSGGALGVDSACHNGAMIAGGKTVLFMGCGLGSDYLPDNAPLRKAVSQNGAVVSEFPPFTPPAKSTFPVRNRLISAMGRTVVVVEAGERSGSLVTARLAEEQGKIVYAVPATVINSSYGGTNFLISKGSRPLVSAYDIIRDYAVLYPEYVTDSGEYFAVTTGRAFIGNEKSEKAKALISLEGLNNSAKSYTIKSKAKKDTASPEKAEKKEEISVPLREKPPVPEGLSPLGEKVYSVLDSSGKTADEIADEAGEEFVKVIAALTELEIIGCAECVSGKRYIFSAIK